MLREQATMVRNSAGARLRKWPNPDIWEIKKSRRTLFVGPKRGHVRGKDDVWSP